MKIDYYVFCLGKIKKYSIDTTSKNYISHNDKFVKMLIWNPFEYCEEETEKYRTFEDVRDLALKQMKEEIDSLLENYNILFNSTKASNE